MTPCYGGVPSLPGRPSFNCSSSTKALAKVIYSQIAGSGPFKLAAGANHYRLLGLEIARAAGTGFIGPLISVTSGTVNHIVLDRVWLHGSPQDDTQTGMNFGGMTYAAVIDSYVDDFHCTSITGSCTDAHAVSGGNSSSNDGVFKITGNFLEASTEAILFGGGGATTTPTDMEIRQNHFFKPLTWKLGQPGYVGGTSGNPFMVKNHLELKNAQRVLIEGNIFENTWGGFSQNGYSILLTPKNQASGTTNICPICKVTDVTIRFNSISHAGAGISMANVPSDNGGIATAGERYSIHDDVLDDINSSFYNGSGSLFQVLSAWPTNVLNSISIRRRCSSSTTTTGMAETTPCSRVALTTMREATGRTLAPTLTPFNPQRRACTDHWWTRFRKANLRALGLGTAEDIRVPELVRSAKHRQAGTSRSILVRD